MNGGDLSIDRSNERVKLFVDEVKALAAASPNTHMVDMYEPLLEHVVRFSRLLGAGALLCVLIQTCSCARHA